MYVARQVTAASLQEIGQQFGGMHHTTVLHSINKIEELRRSDRALNLTITQLMDDFALRLASMPALAESLQPVLKLDRRSIF